MSVRNTDAPIRRKATRDQWMLDFWAEPARHDVTVEERPGIEQYRNEFRHVCKCGYVGPVTAVIVPPETCPVLAALHARERGIQDDGDRRQRERYERPQRLWKRLEP